MIPKSATKIRIDKIKELSKIIKQIEEIETLIQLYMPQHENYETSNNKRNVLLDTFDSQWQFMNKIHFLYPFNYKEADWIRSKYKEFLIDITMEIISRLYDQIRNTKVDVDERI